MYKSRVLLVCIALALILVLLIPLVGCKGSGTTATPTPTGTTTTGATTTPTPPQTVTTGATTTATPAQTTTTPVTTPAATSSGPPLLQLVSWTWDKGSSNLSDDVTGNVTNISGDQIWNVTAVASWYNADGQLIDSEWAWLDSNPIGAGETTSFTVVASHDPTMDHVSISFEYAGDPSKPISFTQ